MPTIFTKQVRDLPKPQGKRQRRGFKFLTSWKNRFKFFTLVFVLLCLSFAATLWYFWEEPLLSPLSSLTTFKFLNTITGEKPSQTKIVYGFLPYWNLNKVTIQPEVTHLAYFSLTIGPDGNIITKTEKNTAEPGYHKLGSDQLLELANQVDANQGQVEIVLTQFDNNDIMSFITNETAHQNLLNSLDAILLAYPISGVNIDIEYTGKITDELRTKLATLMQKLNRHLDQRYSHVQLSIDMYASAASKRQLWDVSAIAKEVDYVIVMAYDFHRRSSTQAGPVAPLFGGDDLWDSDINQHLKAFSEQMPRSKILLGIPFYGYGWQTTSHDSQAHTYPDSGWTVSFQEAQEIISQGEVLGVQEHWHETALAPYLTYTEEEENFIAYYENPRSIAYKLEYVRQLDLAGIAIWALGYEGSGRELWEVIEKLE
ncbi:MAG: hypothetical protein GF390_01830 [Candidatus Pacebacteria bacterium]|nr:hypothetical protein [Candidatus Paceibacterota bacterium]